MTPSRAYPQIDTSVIIKYGGTKAEDIHRTWKRINVDLSALKFPLPKKINIGVWSYNCVRLFWPSLEPGTTLYRQIHQKTQPEFLLSLQDELDRLDIIQITLEEDIRRANGTKGRQLQRYHPYVRTSGLSQTSSERVEVLPNPLPTLPTPSDNHLIEVKLEETDSTLPRPETPESDPFQYRTPSPDLPGPSNTQIAAAIPDKPLISNQELRSDTTSVNVTDLTRELWNIRRELSAGLAREHAIIQTLNRLGAPIADQPSPVTHTDPSVLQSRLHLIERELAEERRRRIEADNILKDIAKEKTQPFVVPALLEAFIAVSKLTTKIAS